MDYPCRYCDKADDRTDYFKCDKPCNNAKQCKKNNEDLIAILGGANIERIMQERKR